MTSSIVNANIRVPRAAANPVQARHRLHRVATTAALVLLALREGLVAMRRYDTLRASGSSHAAAVNRLFDARK
jgi:hypothetical protein